MSGQTANIQFVVKNQGSDQINGLTISVRAVQGWSALSGSINIGTLSSGETRDFQVQVVVGSATIPSLIFSAISTDHIALDFPVSILVARGVIPQVIANEGEQANALMSLIDQGVTYTVYQIGGLLFPTTDQGITSSSDWPGQQLLQGYFTREYLKKDNQAIASTISSLTNAISGIASNAASASAAASQGYTVSIPLLLGTYTYSGSLYEFLTWTIPVSEWIPGVGDVRIADLLARAASQLGVNISGDDIIAFADLLSGMGSVQSLWGYLADLQNYDQLISGLVSNSVPDLSALLNALNSANTILTEIQNVINTVNQFLIGSAQRIGTWIAQLKQTLDQVFNSMKTWVRQNLSLVADAINSFLSWLHDSLTSALSYVFNVIQGFLQARDTSQSAQSNVSAMTSAVPESSNNAWGALSNRLNQVAGEMQQRVNGLCSQYAPVSGYVKLITRWGGLVAIGFGPYAADAEQVVGGLYLADSTIDFSCSYLKRGSVDPVEIISLAAGASGLLGDIFPEEETDFGAISKVLTFVASALSATEQLKASLGSSNYDLSGVSTLISDYQSASNQANTAYHQPNPDYVATLGALASLSNLPSIDAVNSVLQSIQPCSGVVTKLASYEQEGMVAQDLDDQVKACQQTGQSAISNILSGQYTAVLQAASLPALASQLDPAIESRHQQFTTARQALAQLSSAATSLTSCGFMWVQPDPITLNQVNQALRQAQSQYNDGKYSDVLTTAGKEIARAKSADEACTNSAFQAKVEAGGAVGIIGIILIVAVGLTIHRRNSETEETENLEESKHSVKVMTDLPPSSAKQGEAPKEIRPSPQMEMPVTKSEERLEPKVKVTDIDSLKQNVSGPVQLARKTAKKIAQPRKRKPGAGRRKTVQTSLKKPARARRKASEKAQIRRSKGTDRSS